MTVSHQVLIAGRRVAPSRPLVSAASSPALSVMAVVGCVLAVIGWIDWGLLWVPLRFGTVEWEFGTISSSFDALPLATIGTAALAVAAITGGWRRTLIALSGFGLALAMVFVALIGLYALNLPVLLRGVEGLAQEAAIKAVAKTACYSMLYIGTYSWLATRCWRATTTPPLE